jgi:YcxB-like protein
MEPTLNTPVTIKLDEHDVIAADRLYSQSYFRDPASWRPIALIWLAAQAVLLAIYAFSGMYDKGFVEFLIVVEAGLHIGLFIVPILITRLLGPRKARKHFKAMKILHGPIHLSWSAEGLKETTETSTSLTPWNHFPKWREDETSFIIFVAPTMYRVVPKRFLTALQIDALRGYLKKSVGV